MKILSLLLLFLIGCEKPHTTTVGKDIVLVPRTDLTKVYQGPPDGYHLPDDECLELILKDLPEGYALVGRYGCWQSVRYDTPSIQYSLQEMDWSANFKARTK